MRSVKKLAADLAMVSRWMDGLSKDRHDDARRVFNYAKCELERRLSEEPSNPDNLAEKLANMTRIANAATAEAGRSVWLNNYKDELLEQIRNLKTDLQSSRDANSKIANAATAEVGQIPRLKSLIAQQCTEIKDLNKCQTNWLQQIVDLKAANAGLNEQVEILTRRNSERSAAEQKAEQPLSPERRLAIQFAEMPPHTRLPIYEMEHDLLLVHGKRVAEYGKASEAYIAFKCLASELTGALGALTDIRIRLTGFAKLREEYQLARNDLRVATLDYQGNQIALAALDDAHKRLHRVVGELEALCEDSGDKKLTPLEFAEGITGTRKSESESEDGYFKRIGFPNGVRLPFETRPRKK